MDMIVAVLVALAGFQLAVPFFFRSRSCPCPRIHLGIASVDIHKNRPAHANAIRGQKNLSEEMESVHERARRALHVP